MVCNFHLKKKEIVIYDVVWFLEIFILLNMEETPKKKKHYVMVFIHF